MVRYSDIAEKFNKIDAHRFAVAPMMDWTHLIVRTLCSLANSAAAHADVAPVLHLTPYCSCGTADPPDPTTGVRAQCPRGSCDNRLPNTVVRPVPPSRQCHPITLRPARARDADWLWRKFRSV
jgi:hypothetical protein